MAISLYQAARNLLPQHLCRRKRVDQRALGDVADGNELVRPMRYGQQAWSVSERRNAASSIESRFEQAWAHLEDGFFTGYTRYVARQNSAELISRWSCRRGLLLKNLNFETFKRVEQPALFFVEVFFGIQAAVDRERTEFGGHVKVRTCLDPPTQKQNGFTSGGWSDVLSRFPKLYFLLDVGKTDDRRQGTLECIYTFELPAHVRGFSAYGGAQRNGSAVGVPNDAA